MWVSSSVVILQSSAKTPSAARYFCKQSTYLTYTCSLGVRLPLQGPQHSQPALKPPAYSFELPAWQLSLPASMRSIRGQPTLGACAHAWQTLPGLELLLAFANAGVASVVSMSIHHGLPDGVRSVVLQPVGPKGLRDVHLIIQLIIQVISLLKVIKVLKALIVQFVLLALTAA